MLTVDKKEKNIEGAITVEACIVVTMFIFFVLFLYSLLPMFLGYHAIGRAVLQTSESLSLDPYSAEKFYNSTDSIESVGDFIASIAVDRIDEVTNPHYGSHEKWYEVGVIATPVVISHDDGAAGGHGGGGSRGLRDGADQAAKDRFIAYFANGDEERAKELLDAYNVVDGLDGLNFSESKVENGVLYVTVKYKMDYEFNFFDMAKQDVTQSAKAKLWM